MQKKLPVGLLYTLISGLVILIGTVTAIYYAQGNFRVTRQGYLPESGLLAANSFPSGAEIVINDRIVSATDDTIYLEPGQYNVKILRDGYSPWEKNLTINKGLVTQTNATLFPSTPSLTPLSFNGVDNLLPSPDGLKLLYYTASASAQRTVGLYILDMADTNFLTFNKEPRQIAQDTSQSFDFATSNYIWSPDSNEVLVMSESKHVLLDITKEIDIATQADVTFQNKRILQEWEEEMYVRERQFLGEFPVEVITIATASAKNVHISPDKKRLLFTYTGTTATLPEGLVPAIPARNTQPENRRLEPGNIYVYDREEDLNYLVGTDPEFTRIGNKQLLATDLASRTPVTLQASPSAFTSLQASTSAQTAQNFHSYHTTVFNDINLQWFTDSKHLVYTTDGTVRIKEYDNTNDTPIFNGPFAQNFAYPWPNGSRLIIATNFRPGSANNLYAIELKR